MGVAAMVTGGSSQSGTMEQQSEERLGRELAHTGNPST